jgi:hypothetical protein
LERIGFIARFKMESWLNPLIFLKLPMDLSSNYTNLILNCRIAATLKIISKCPPEHSGQADATTKESERSESPPE